MSKAFDNGDNVLIQELINSGMQLDEIAKKWSVTYRQLTGYCSATGVIMPKRSPEKNGCHQRRLAVERGSHVSPTVAKIITLSKSYSVKDIAGMVNRSVEFVRRMLDVHVKKDINNRHSQTVDAVRQLANSKDIPIAAACAMLNLTPSQYSYSLKRINKKAPE